MIRIEIIFSSPVKMNGEEMMELFLMADEISVRETSKVSITFHNTENEGK